MKIDRIKFFKELGIFSNLGSDELSRIAAMTREEERDKDDVIVAENIPGNALYMVLSGEVRVTRQLSEMRTKTLAILGPGAFFGEMTLLDGTPTSATVSTTKKTRMMVLDKTRFDSLLVTEPRMAIKMLIRMVQVLAGRLKRSNDQIVSLTAWGLGTGSNMPKNQPVRAASAKEASGKPVAGDSDGIIPID